jgi:hypothetical protein
MLLDTAKAGLQSLHDNLVSNVQRWGSISDGENKVNSSGCYASLRLYDYQEAAFVYVVFQGDGTHFTIEELTDFEKQNEKVGAITRGYNQFEGTDRSLKWVQFLLSPQSPWRALHPYLASKSADEINKSGWIFENIPQIPTKLFYNFCMAQRFLWENSPAASHWFHLVDAGVAPEKALFIASNFVLSPGATSIDGPYSVYYPWSFLEGGDMDCCRKFVTGEPTITSGTQNTPNVLPLWQCKDHPKWRIKTNELATNFNLSLQQVVLEVDVAVQTQEI